MNELLHEHNDDWEAVLPMFSELRVKEGNALTDLSFHSFGLSAPTQLMILLRQNARRYMNKIFPSWLVELEPMNEIGKGMKLSVAYDKMMQLGYMKYVRRENNEIMQAHFEKTTGMVTTKPASHWTTILLTLLLIPAIGMGAFYYSGSNIYT